MQLVIPRIYTTSAAIPLIVFLASKLGALTNFQVKLKITMQAN